MRRQAGDDPALFIEYGNRQADQSGKAFGIIDGITLAANGLDLPLEGHGIGDRSVCEALEGCRRQNAPPRPAR